MYGFKIKIKISKLSSPLRIFTFFLLNGPGQNYCIIMYYYSIYEYFESTFSFWNIMCF